MSDWTTDYPRNIRTRYPNDLLSGGGSGGATVFDPANPVYHGTGTTNAVLNTTTVGPGAAGGTAGASAFGYQTNVDANGTAIGRQASSTAAEAVAIHAAQASGSNSLAIMRGSVATGEESQAIGVSSTTNGFGQLAYGRGAICGTTSDSSIAIGDSATVGANNGASCAFGASCVIGDNAGLSCLIGPSNNNQATATNSVVCGVSNAIAAGSQTTRIFGAGNIVGANCVTNIIAGDTNTLVDASTGNVLITDAFTTGGVPTKENAIVGLNASCTSNGNALLGFETSSSVDNGVAIGNSATAAEYVFQLANPIAINTDASCLLGAGAVVANERLVIRINSQNYVIAVQRE